MLHLLLQDVEQLRTECQLKAQAARDTAGVAEAVADSLKQKRELQQAFVSAAGSSDSAVLDAHLQRLRCWFQSGTLSFLHCSAIHLVN